MDLLQEQPMDLSDFDSTAFHADDQRGGDELTERLADATVDYELLSREDAAGIGV